MPITYGLSRSSLWILLLVATLTSACSGGSSGPQQGTPEWYMQAATENFAIPDYGKTVEQLGEVTGTPGELGARALLWRTVLTGGLALGYDELHDAFVEGAKANEARVADFQNSINDYRRRTRINAIEFSESMGKIKSFLDAQETVTLDFPLPSGNGSASPILGSVEAGNKVDSQITAMEDQTLTRGIFSVVSSLTGGAEFSKLVADAQGAGIQATREQFFFGAGRILLDLSVMFDREGINDPRIRGHVLDMAENWATPHFENEDFAERVEEFQFDLENERRDIAGKRRIKKKD